MLTKMAVGCLSADDSSSLSLALQLWCESCVASFSVAAASLYLLQELCSCTRQLCRDSNTCVATDTESVNILGVQFVM